MSWQARFANKVVTAEESVLAIRRGDRILIGSGSAEPNHLVSALVTHGTHLEGNEIVHLLTLGPAPYVQPGMAKRFRHTAFFIGKNVRDAVHEGRADFMPVFLSEIPELIRSRRVRIDVALIQITPPDRFGCSSLGTSVDIVRAAVDSADLVIAQVNPLMPRTLGDSFIDMSQIDYLVPHEEPLLELPMEPPDDASLEIGRQVAALVPDGATLQMGIGSIPDAVLKQLVNRVDLGVHTEMFSDGAMELAEAGVITGRRKTVLHGKMTTSFVMGSRKLYDWVNDNPRVEFRPSEYTNDPWVIARHDSMIAINSALAVDLTGQVAADTLMGRFFSGIGGQVDFIRGSARSRGGKPIIALPATAKGGTVSRIQPAFSEGAGVVTSRGDVHYVVTEYGIADLWGRSIRQRAMALIAIAHPDFRAELLQEAKKRHYVFPDQAAPRATYPWTETRDARLTDGANVTIRPAHITDEESLSRLFYSVSPEDTDRLLTAFAASSSEHLSRVSDLDYDRSMMLVATPAGAETEEVVALARYQLDPATRMAHIGVLVRSDYQRRGLGTALVQRLIEIGRARGFAGLTASVSHDNRPMLDILYKSGVRTATRPGADGRTDHIETYFDTSEGSRRSLETPGKAREPATNKA